MSSEKGEALVRSPPAIVGVDTYKTHIPGGAPTWADHQKHQIVGHKLQHQPPQKNVSVTKLSSGESSNIAGNNRGSHGKQKDRKQSRSSGGEDVDKSCPCGGWARAKQLSHDLQQLKQAHETILNGLHHQVEELKFKNRDLIFQLLMGPFASDVRVGVPQSPESDVTSPKDNRKFLENKSTSTSEAEQETEANSKKQQTLKQKKNENSQIVKSQLIGLPMRPGDSRQVKSLDLEMLEEEASENRRQFEEEKAKNGYLVNLVEDLKRQLRESTGNWQPAPTTSKKSNQNSQHKNKALLTNRHHQTPATQSGNNDGSTISTFRLPSIALPNTQQNLKSPDGDADDETADSNPPQRSPVRSRKQMQLKGERSNERKGSKGTTILPAIGPSGRARCSQSPSSESLDKSSQQQQRHEPSPGRVGGQGPNRQKGKGKVSSKDDQNKTNQPDSNTDEPSLSSDKQPCRRYPSPRQERSSPSKQDGKKTMSPSARRRAAGTNNTSLTKTRASPRTSPHLDPSRESSRNRKLLSSDSSPMRRLDHGSGMVNGEVHPDINSCKPFPQRTRTKGQKNSSSERKDKVDLPSCTTDGAMASSSSSISSVPSTANRPKHRGKSHRKGKKNRKEPPAETPDSKPPQ